MFELLFVWRWLPANILALVLIISGPSSLMAMTTYRTVHISSTPSGAVITTNGTVAGSTPLTLPDFPFDREAVLTVVASLDGYESQTATKYRSDADAILRQYKDEPGMQLSFDLQPLQYKASVRLEAGNGARFSVDGSPAQANTTLVFRRDNSTSPWKKIKIRAERDNYESQEIQIDKGGLTSLPLDGDKIKIQFNLVETRRVIHLDLKVNVDGAQVYLNDQNLNSAAGLDLVFLRNGSSQPWSQNTIKIAKDGYEYRPPAPAETTPDLTMNLTLEQAESLNGKLAAMNFQPLRQLPVPWLKVVVDHGVVRLSVTNVMSAISPEGTMNQFDPNFVGDDEYFIADRFATAPASQDAQVSGKPLPLVVAVAKRATRDGVPAEVIGSQIVKVNPPPQKIKAPLTSIGDTQGTYDLQPCLSGDGKYVYFSSNRSDDGQYHIFNIPADGKRILTEVTHPQPGIDMEPTVFTDHDGKNHLAFTRYPTKSAVRSEPHIMIQTSDGNFAQVGDPGHSPVWSHDGTHIAYVSMKGKICVMTPEDGNSIELEAGTAPAWLPGDKQIVFGKPNGNSYSLTVINSDGSNEVNPIADATSFYSFPTVSFDDQKTFIYFVSNRQVQQRGDPKAWGLYYIEWKQ